MDNDGDTQSRVFDWDGLSDQLLEQGLDTSPAALHGCLSGLLAGGAEPQAELGLDALSQALGLVLHGELAEEAMRLYTVTAAALEDEEFDFHPLLPPDEVDLGERTLALASWSRGFLSGFAFQTAKLDRGDAPLPGESSEILKDFAALSQAVLDDEEDEQVSENSFMELYEYLRFATLNFYMENSPAEQTAGTRPGPDPLI
jgi:uncharacterized protein YgfB (UPF0149 family)